MLVQAMLAASAAGFVASLASLAEYRGSLKACRAGGKRGCGALYALPQARLAGVHLSEAAPWYFSLLLLLSLLYAASGLWCFLAAVNVAGLLGALLVPYLVYLELSARSFCLYCTVMHAAILFGLVCSLLCWGVGP